MKNIYILITSIFLSFITFGQDQSNSINLITDRTEYVAGENIWFKVYLNSELKESTLIYAEIISPFGYVVNRKKVLIKNGIGTGNFIISDTISTGYYTFLVYANELKNKGYENFCRENILIYNPEKKIIKAGHIKELKKEFIKDNYSHNSLIDIVELQKKYQTRSRVSFSIKGNDEVNIENANISVSVRKAKPVELFNKPIDYQYKDISSKAKLFYREKNGAIVSGQIINSDKKYVQNIKINLCTVDSVSVIQTTKTDSSGRFYFLIPVEKKNKDIVIIAESKEDVSIILDNKFINNYTSFKGSFIEETDSQTLNYLNQLYINHRINKLYKISQIGIEDLKLNNESNKNNFYDYPDKVINFDDYIVLDSVQEYFHEFFPSIFIQNKDGKRVFKIVNEFKDVLLSQPAIFIDGVLYSNNDILFSVNTEICDRIEVVKSNYLIYNKLYGGLICLYTKNSALSTIPLPNNSSRIDYSLHDDSYGFSVIRTNTNTPNFQNTLYWNPSIIFYNSNTVEIEFETGDVIGDYTIDIFGLTDTNKVISVCKTFSIIK